MKKLRTPLSPEEQKIIKNEMAKAYCEAAEYFDDNLGNKDILIFAEGHKYVINFFEKNFYHLCGVDSNLQGWKFYAKAIKKQLGPKHFFFSKRFPMFSAYDKSQVLLKLFQGILGYSSSDISILTDLKTAKREEPFDFAFHIEDSSACSLCFSFAPDDNKNEAMSVRTRKVQREHINDLYKIDYIFIKDAKDSQYKKICLGDKSKLKDYIIYYGLLGVGIDIDNLTDVREKQEGKKIMTIKSKHANVKENNINIGEVVSLVTKKHNSSLERLGMELPEQKFEKDDIIFIHDTMIKDYGGIYGVRDEGLLDASVSNPYQSVFGEDLYPTVYDKASKYLFDFAHYQIFNDGNKRTGLATMEAYLIANGYDFTMDAKAQYQFVMDIANNKYVEIPDIAKIIEENTIFLPKKDINFFNDDIIYNDNKDITGNEDQNYERE